MSLRGGSLPHLDDGPKHARRSASAAYRPAWRAWSTDFRRVTGVNDRPTRLDGKSLIRGLGEMVAGTNYFGNGRFLRD